METVKVVTVLCLFISTTVYVGLVVYASRIMKTLASKAMDIFVETLKEENQDNEESSE